MQAQGFSYRSCEVFHRHAVDNTVPLSIFMLPCFSCSLVSVPAFPVLSTCSMRGQSIFNQTPSLLGLLSCPVLRDHISIMFQNFPSPVAGDASHRDAKMKSPVFNQPFSSHYGPLDPRPFLSQPPPPALSIASDPLRFESRLSQPTPLSSSSPPDLAHPLHLPLPWFQH